MKGGGRWGAGEEGEGRGVGGEGEEDGYSMHAHEQVHETA